MDGKLAAATLLAWAICNIHLKMKQNNINIILYSFEFAQSQVKYFQNILNSINQFLRNGFHMGLSSVSVNYPLVNHVVGVQIWCDTGR